MKFINYLLIIIAAVFFVSACQKELGFDQDGIARGTLKKDNTTGECLPSTVNGIYKQDSILNNTNFIDIQLNLTTTGTYEVKSDTVNGYSFKGTGTLGLVGLNTVRLYATGKPLLAGIDAFTISFDGSSCVISVIVIGANTGVAVFTLEGAPGACSGAVVSGTYTMGSPLVIDNTVTITINVISPGTYLLGAVSVNGMLFSSTGYFPNPGLQAVTLNGTGVPLQVGIFNVTASNGTSNCTFSITVVPPAAGTSVYTLDIAGGACSGAAYTGTYTAGTPLTATNIVLINVNVTAVGSYSITTTTDNGMSFSATGSFIVTGPQPLVLVGSGTPIAAGTFNFTASTGVTGSANCTFSVTVSGTTNLEYIPETDFSNWSERVIGGTASDTTYTQVSTNSIVINANTYKIFEEKVLGVAIDSFYHRKNAGMYYTLVNSSYGFDNPFNVDAMVLDSSLAANASWVSDLGSNTIGGLPGTAKITATILQKGAVVLIASNTYSNVIKVKYIFSADLGSGYVDKYQWEIWFAKGKGVVYQKANNIPVTSTLEQETTRLQIF
ncbi:hypothetical protein BH11BAC4_BH11BAC4_07450 [soil metagenome]